MHFEIKTKDEYKIIVNSLTDLIGKITKQIDEAFSTLNNYAQTKSIIVHTLFNNIRVIRELEWVERFKKNVYSFNNTSIKYNIIDFVEMQKSKINELNVSLENAQSLEDACRIYKSITELSPITNLYEELKEIFASVEQGFMNRLKIELSSFNQTTEHFKTSIDYEYIKTGAALGRVGPVTEGLLIWTLGLGLLIGIAVWLTAKAR